MSADVNRTLTLRSLLDLCRPPDGFRFVRGAWATHDLAMEEVADWVAPALTGVVSGDRRHRRHAAWAEGAASCELAIFANADPHRQYKTFVPWCTVDKVGNRRQHAKFVLLQFQSEAGGRTRTRAIVTSANLTSGGLRRNWEILATEEIGHRASGDSLAVSLLAEFRVLARDCAPSKGTKRLLDQIGEALSGDSYGGLHSSVKKAEPLLKGFTVPGRARRLIVVSPPFASDHDEEAVDLVSSFIDAKTSVEIYTGANVLANRKLTKVVEPQFSNRIIDGFRRRCARVRVFAIPELVEGDEDSEQSIPRRRCLHAKLLAFVDAEGTANILVGSANFTRSGLGGKNRELMVEVTRTEKQLDEILKELSPIECKGKVQPPREVEPQTDNEPPLDVSAVFVVDEDESPVRGQIWGTLTLTWTTKPTQIFYGNERLKVTESQPLCLKAGDATLRIVVGKREETAPVQVTARNPEFWQRIGPDDPEKRPDQSWRHLLLDMRRAAAPQHLPTGTELAPRQPGQKEDGFYLPLEQRLVVLARHRQKLRDYLDADTVEQRIQRYFQGQPASASQVGRAVMSPYLRLKLGPGTDPLLLALGDAIRSFDGEASDA